MNKITLKDLGYSNYFENNPSSISQKDIMLARIISEHKGLYILRNEVHEFSAKITGKMMFTASSREDYPAVGDWVLTKKSDKNSYVIKEILPRKSILQRKSAGNFDSQIIASNIDVAFIVQSLDRDYSLNRIERYLSLVKTENIKPVIILNKIDLISSVDLDKKIFEIITRFNDVDVYLTSTVTGKGINDLKNSTKQGLTYCLIGSSGVGKSSIINAFLGEDLIKTGKISSRANRGKHVTSSREIFILERGGLLIDTPGMREIGILDAETGIKDVFSEIDEISKGCRFSNCRHINEPDCAVLESVRSEDLDQDVYDNYIKLVKENEHNTMSKLEKRGKDKKIGKFIKTSKKIMKQANHKFH
jgi:ribosome biogenesis GTPase / thiamine phosphate phosphatase